MSEYDQSFHSCTHCACNSQTNCPPEQWSNRKLYQFPNLDNVDGTENKRGKITHYCWLRVLYNGEQKLQRFFLMSLGKDRMILGYPFLREFNPQIDWSEGKLQGGMVSLQSTKFRYLRRLFRRAEETLKETGRLPRKLVAFLRRTNL